MHVLESRRGGRMSTTLTSHERYENNIKNIATPYIFDPMESTAGLHISFTKGQ